MTYKEAVYKLLNILLYTNLIGAAVGACWIMFSHGWVSVGIALLLLGFSQILIPVLLFPSGFFSNFMIFFQMKKKPVAEKIMFCLSASYVAFFFAAWCSGLFSFAIASASGIVSLATLLWAVCLPMVPLFMWVRKDEDNPFMVTVVESAQISIILLAVYAYIAGEFSLKSNLLISFVFMLLAMSAIFSVEKFITSKSK